MLMRHLVVCAEVLVVFTVLVEICQQFLLSINTTTTTITHRLMPAGLTSVYRPLPAPYT